MLKELKKGKALLVEVSTSVEENRHRLLTPDNCWYLSLNPALSRSGGLQSCFLTYTEWGDTESIIREMQSFDKCCGLTPTKFTVL